MTLVVDASVCVSFLLGDVHADWVRARLRHEAILHAPSLIDFEVASALRAVDDRQRFLDACEDLRAMRLVRHAGESLLPRTWQLRGHITAYDAAYVALAEALEYPLVTLDRRLARAGGHAAAVEVP